MPRVFDDANPDYLTLATLPTSLSTRTPGYTLSGWFYSDSLLVRQGIVGLGNVAADTDELGLYANGTTANDPVSVRVAAAGANLSGATLTYATDTWQHAAGVVTTDDIQGFLNGVSGTATVDNRAPVGMDTIRVGNTGLLAAALGMSGRLFWPAIHAAPLLAQNILQLFKGAHPGTVRRDVLIFFADCKYDADRDRISGAPLTITNTPTIHPTIPPNCRLLGQRLRARRKGRTRRMRGAA